MAPPTNGPPVRNQSQMLLKSVILPLYNVLEYLTSCIGLALRARDNPVPRHLQRPRRDQRYKGQSMLLFHLIGIIYSR